MNTENTTGQAPPNPPAEQPAPAKAKKKKKKRPAWKVVLIVLIWLVVIAAVIFVTLFLASRIAQFESIGAMLNYIRGVLNI